MQQISLINLSYFRGVCVCVLYNRFEYYRFEHKKKMKEWKISVAAEING